MISSIIIFIITHNDNMWVCPVSGCDDCSKLHTASLLHNQRQVSTPRPPQWPQWPGINILRRAPHLTQFVENLDIMKFLVGLFLENGSFCLSFQYTFSDIFSFNIIYFAMFLVQIHSDLLCSKSQVIKDLIKKCNLC